MLTQDRIDRLKKKLVHERDRALGTHTRLEGNRENLVEREVEFQENAQKDGLLEPMSSIDDSEKKQLDAIVNALKKIDIGGYGFCERCGREIDPERLDVLPWAPLCSTCQADAEGGSRSESGEEEENPALPPDLEGLQDDDILRYVLNELEEDGRVDLEEVTIECDRGVVHLDGFLPSEAQHQILLEIILDGIGIGSLTDHVTIDPLLWETNDRARGTRGPDDEEKSDDDDTLSDDDETSDAYVSRTSGAPFQPPDEMIPEDKGRK